MPLRIRRFCSSWLKLNTKCLLCHGIVSGFVTLAFLFFMLLTINNCSWFPKRFDNTGIIPTGNPFHYLKGQKNDSGQRKNLEISLNSQITGNPDKTLPDYIYIINEPNKCRVSRPFLILLIAVQAWQSEARQAIRQTWGKEDLLHGVQTLRLFLLGTDAAPNNAQQALVDESQKYRDIIQQDFLDTYNNLTLKTLMGLKWVTTYCPQIPYVMKTDSDMFVNTEYLVNKLLLPDQPPRKNYFTGTGYVFSGDLAEKILKVSASIKLLHLEDVFVGICLYKLGVSPVPPPKDSDFNHWKRSYSHCLYNQIVTSHQFEPKELIAYWDNLQEHKHTCV
ncbi:hypothetical protein GDO78_009333 [Eleutherodactylus coqui]|uniref:Hexosyltransferase n=1 Tax=Eleutherodactylus coqui TaxID=57060 RepID=A0A8J6K8T5_ELECQ|nr:hypothetical protein GDO78_009333 [Eleutherodactylus coqui]